MDGGGTSLGRQAGDLTTAATELAQAGSGDAVGRIETSNGNATVTRTDGAKVKADVGLDIFQGDVVETVGKSSVGILFADNSTFSLADDGKMTIDEMVYDPGTQEGSAAMSVTTGVFTFISGQIAKTAVDAMLINTPTSTIGIRGTSIAAKVGGKNGDTFTLLEDQQANPAANNAKLNGQAGDDTLLAQAPGGPPSGEVVISNDVGSQTLNQPNATSSVSSRFSSPTIPINLPPSVVNQVYAAAISVAVSVAVRAAAQAAGQQSGGQEGGGQAGQQTPEGGAEAGAQAEGGTEADAAAEGGVEQALNAAEAEAQDAAADAFADALANGGDLDAAMAAATDAAAETKIQAVLAFDVNAFGSANSIASSMGGLINDAMGALGFEAGDPMDSGTGGDTIMDQQSEAFDDGAAEMFDAIIGDSIADAQDAIGDIMGDLADSGLIDPLLAGTFNAAYDNLADEGFLSEFGGGFGDFGDGGFEGDPFGDVFDDIFQDIFFEAFDDTLDFLEAEFIDDVDETIADLENEAAGNPTTTISFSTSASDTLVNGVNDYYVGADGSNDQLFLYGKAQAGDVFDGGTGNDTVTFHDTGVDHIFRVYDVERVVLSDTNSGTFQLNHASAGSITVDMANATGTVSISGTADGSTSQTLDQHFTMVSNGAIGGTASLEISGSGGNDTLTLDSGTHTIDGMVGIEYLQIAGSATTMVSALSGVDVTASSGSALLLSDSGNSLTISSSSVLATLSGGASTDQFATSGATIATLTGGSGTDVLNFGGTSNTVTAISGIESIVGGTGTDSATLANTTHAITVSGVIETFAGGTGTEVISFSSSGGELANVSAIATIVGGIGTDIVSFGDAGETTTLSNVETIIGGSGADVLTLAAAQSSGTFSLGAGLDQLTLHSGTGNNTLTLSKIETIVGGSGDDILTLGAAQGSGTITGGAGTDTVIFANGTNSLGLSTVETIVGGTGTDIVTLGSGVNNTVSISGVETISGGDGNDTMNLGAAISSGGRISGGGGTQDTANLADGANSFIFFGTETINGGTGNDTITEQADGTNTFINGGAGDDDMTGNDGDDHITGGSGADRFIFSGNTAANLGTDILVDFSGATAFGGGGGDSDQIILDTSNLSISSISYLEVAWNGTSGDTLTVGGASVVVLHGNAGTLADAATALAASDASATNAVFLFNDSANSNLLTLIHTADMANDGTTSDLATFSSITDTSASTNLAAGDFDVQA